MSRKRQYPDGLAALLFFVLLSAPLLLAAGAPELEVEGVVSGLQGDSEELSAVIGGEIYSVGQHVGSYEITAVEMGQVSLRGVEDGQSYILPVGSRPAPEQPEVPPPVKESWVQAAIRKYLPDLAVFQQKMKYSRVVTDLRKIYMEAMQEALTRGDGQVSIADLVARGRLPSFMKEERDDGYHFRIMPVKQGVRVYAEPVSGSHSELYFMIDEHNYIYAEKGARASQKSERFDSSYRIELS